MDAKDLLTALKNEFPLPPPPFAGTHSLTLGPDGRLTISIWTADADGKPINHPISGDNEDFNLPIDDIVKQLKEVIG